MLDILSIISLIILCVGFAVLLVSYIRFKRLTVSLEQIALVVKSVRYGNLTKRVKIRAKGKIAQVAVNINKMIDYLQDKETKIKLYQKELQEKKEYLEAIFNSLVDGILTISNECDIISVNPAAMAWIGLKEEEIVGRKLIDLLKCKCDITCENDFDKISEICPLIMLSERLCPTEATIINNDTGVEKFLGLSSSLVSGIKGEPTHVIVLRDITQLKEIDKLKEDFVATLTHDLRVPILAEANTLKFFLRGTFGEFTGKQQVAMENLLESNNELLSLVNSLLDTYKYESGKSELFKEFINIRRLADDAVRELASLAVKHNQILECGIKNNITEVFADKKEIKRVINNLLSNAIFYTPKGGKIVIQCENNDGNIIFSVSDNGKGIPEHELEMVFDRFFSKAKKFRKIGTGLGLYLSKQIIERHNGKIWAESKVGQGSTFYFSLPL